MKKTPPTEKAEQRAIVRLYEAIGCHVYSFSQPRKTMQTPGIPDLYVIHPGAGQAWWHEVKRQVGPDWALPPSASAQRPEQREFQERVEACGDIYILGSRTDAKNWLEAIGILLP